MLATTSNRTAKLLAAAEAALRDAQHLPGEVAATYRAQLSDAIARVQAEERAVKGHLTEVFLKVLKSRRPRNAKLAPVPAVGPGVTIQAHGGVSVDGLEQVAAMMQRLDATLRAPVKPIYDENGILVGARRSALPGDESSAGGATLAAMEARLKAVEQKPAMKYRGVWKSEARYDAGDITTDGGSMWHCNRSTMARPGTSGDWTLAVKRGRDAHR
jgi:hypothetical protein